VTQITFFAEMLLYVADKIKAYDLSFKSMEENNPSHIFNQDTHRMLFAANNAKEWKFVLDFCKQLRTNGIHDSSRIYK